MISKNARCELCCCAATWLCLAAFMLVLFAFDYAAENPVSPLRLPLIVAAGIAFVLMVASVAAAIRMEPMPDESEMRRVTRRQLRRLPRHRAARPSVPRHGT
jgi:hypothetical protein